MLPSSLKPSVRRQKITASAVSNTKVDPSTAPTSVPGFLHPHLQDLHPDLHSSSSAIKLPRLVRSVPRTPTSGGPALGEALLGMLRESLATIVARRATILQTALRGRMRHPVPLDKAKDMGIDRKSVV